VISSPILEEYLGNGRSETCPIIDIHGHIGHFYGAFLPSAPLDRMIASMKRHGVRTIVCSSHRALAYDVGAGNDEMQRVIDSHPGLFLGYWVVNPNHPEQMRKDLDRFASSRGFVGFKLWADYHLIPIVSPKYEPALEYAEEHGLLQKVHTFGDSPFNSPQMLGSIAEKHPRADFLMAHCGYGDWETSMRVARDLPNVYLDLTSVVQSIDFALMPGGSFMPSAITRSPMVNGIIEEMVEVVGQEKILFGSDLPWYSQAYHAGAILFADISDEARHAIFHGNAERLLKAHLGGVRREQ
jgi:hypothetical protein